MKIKLILFSIMLSFCSNNLVKAQSLLRYGVKISLSESQFDIKDIKPLTVGSSSFYIDYINEPSIHPSIGGFVKTDIVNNLGLELEVLFLPKGSSKNSELSVTTASQPDGTGEIRHFRSEMNLNYCQAGLNIQPKISIDNVIVFITGGASMNYLLTVTGFAKEDVKDVVVGYNYGLGLGLEKLLSMPVFIEAKWSGELTPINTPTAKFYNNVFTVNLGITI